MTVMVAVMMDRLIDLEVKASASRTEDLGIDSRLRRGEFSGSSHTIVLKTGCSVATQPGFWS